MQIVALCRKKKESSLTDNYSVPADHFDCNKHQDRKSVV